MSLTGRHQATSEKSRIRLYFAAFSGSLLYVSAGCTMAWSSPSLQPLVESGQISPQVSGWLASVYALGAILGPPISGFTLDRLGRKLTMFIYALFFLVSWILLSISQNVFLMYLARIIGGIGVGGAFSSVPIYVAEISDDEARGALGVFNQVFLGIGFLLEYSIGPYSSYNVLLMCSAYAVLAFGIIFSFMPDSPLYLVAAGRKEDAISALCWLRGDVPPHSTQREMQSIEEHLDISKKTLTKKSDLLKRRGPVKALSVCLLMMFCQQMSGFNMVLGYTQPIFGLTRVTLSPALLAILIGTLNVVASFGSPPLVASFGMKWVLIVSGFGMGLCNIVLACYFYMVMIGYDVVNLSSIPIFSLLIFNVFFCVGVGPIPWTLAAEMFPAALKGLATSLIGVFVWLLAFVVLKSYTFVEIYGPFFVFLTYGLVTLVGVALLAFLLPDTRELSLQDIQDLLEGRGSMKKEESED